jgi:hypothetical protein
MKTSTILETSIRYSLPETWQRCCTVLTDAPLSAAFWKLGEMTGEGLLKELPEIQVLPEQLVTSLN